jgi:predicted nucleotide-binding protein (sugar kinase/HSP70/actin superfamily)
MNKKKKIKVAFPHMGTIYVVWATALRKLGVEPFIPPYTNKKTLSLGTKYSPESICLPYKLILGNFIEAIEGGADYVAMISSPGICRLGEYGESIQSVLKDIGYNAKYVKLELYDGIKGMYHFMSEISGCKNPFLVLGSVISALVKVFSVDKLENILTYYRAREIKRGSAERAFNKGLKLLYEADSWQELKKAEKEKNGFIEAQRSLNQTKFH